MTRRDEEWRESPLLARPTPFRRALFSYDHVFFRSSLLSLSRFLYPKQVMLVQGCDPWSPKALRSAMGATFKAPCVSEASDWEGTWACIIMCVGVGVLVLCVRVMGWQPFEGRKACMHDSSDSFQSVMREDTHPMDEQNTRTAAKTALRARHGAKLQFVAADGGEALPDYDSIDWTGTYIWLCVIVWWWRGWLCDTIDWTVGWCALFSLVFVCMCACLWWLHLADLNDGWHTHTYETGPSVLVVGNEGNGLCDAVRTELAGGKGVKGGRIPLAGKPHV